MSIIYRQDPNGPLLHVEARAQSYVLAWVHWEGELFDSSEQSSHHSMSQMKCETVVE